LRNDGGNKNNWIEVRVKCTKSNGTGFGTKVAIEAGGVTQTQEIGGQTSYLSQNFQRAHFGLNRDEEATHLTVTFPSGIVRTMDHVQANQIVSVTE
jgi:enediyne biosynthesis protein E4